MKPFPMLFQEIAFTAQELAFAASLLVCALFGMEYRRLKKEQENLEALDEFLRD